MSAALLLLPVAAYAATTDPALQRSEQLDTRRLGKVSDDERSVLRIEWRSAVSGADEANTVKEMLDGLRRMEVTIGEINRLVGAIRTDKPVVAGVAPEPPESDGNSSRLMIASIVVACLVVLWLFRRRNSAKASAVTTIPHAAPDTSPPGENAPAMAAVPEVAQPSRTEAPKVQPRATPEPFKPKPAPPPLAEPVLQQAAPRRPANPEPSAAPATADNHAIDFLLEEADPEIVARENAKLQQIQTLNRRKAPERKPEAEVEPTLELAGIMLSLGLEQGAAQALIEYTEANPRQALQHWLKLLEIYRNSGHRKDFKEAAEKLRQNFNVQAEDWIEASKGTAPTLEDFSRVAEHVQKVWSQPAECIEYLQELLIDNREGSRTGFPQPVAEEILLLMDILKQISRAS